MHIAVLPMLYLHSLVFYMDDQVRRDRYRNINMDGDPGDAEPTSPWRVETEVRARLREHADASVIVIAFRYQAVMTCKC